MLSQFKKSLVLISLLTVSVQSYAQDTAKTPEVTPPSQTTEEFVEIQTDDGQSFLVNKKNLIRIQDALPDETKKAEETSAPAEKEVTKTETLSTTVETTTKKETQEEVKKEEDLKPEVKATETTNDSKAWDGTTKVETKEEVVVEETQDNVVVEKKSETVKSTTEPLLLPDPAVTEPTNTEMFHEATTVKVETTHKKPKRFSMRTAVGYGTFTTISDINSTYSFGFGLGYDITRTLNVELQYIFSEFEDTYNYGYYGGYAYDSKFGQNDIAVILNYKVLPSGPFKLNLRGGLNYSYRSVRDSYWGYSDSSNALAAIIGIGADFRITDGIFISGNIDYNLNLNDSGYSYEPSPLDLVAGENYTNFNIGVKFKF